jgi:hypothetical protein
MAPPSRPISATSSDGSKVIYRTKRAASLATGVSPTTISSAALKRSKFCNLIWKYEDDPRPVEMTLFKGIPYMLLESDVVQGAGLMDALRSNDGRLITALRTNDGYVAATPLCKFAGKAFADYSRLASTRTFITLLSQTMNVVEEHLST